MGPYIVADRKEKAFIQNTGDRLIPASIDKVKPYLTKHTNRQSQPPSSNEFEDKSIINMNSDRLDSTANLIGDDAKPSNADEQKIREKLENSLAERANSETSPATCCQKRFL